MLRNTRCNAYNIYAAGWGLFFGDRDIRTITVGELREWKVVRLRQVKPGTVHLQMALLSGAFQQAREDGIPVENAVRLAGWDKSTTIRQRFFTPEEESALLSQLGELRDYARFAVLTGLRIGEQLGIQWGDEQGESLYVRPQKTKKGRWIPLHPDALAILAGRNHLALPFPREYSQVAQPFRRLLRRLGIKGACWHTWRHTHASRLVQAGVSIYLVSKLLGHSSVVMTMRYSHLAMDDLQDAIRRLR